MWLPDSATAQATTPLVPSQTSTTSASAARCQPQLLREEVLGLVKPLMELRIKQAEERLTDGGTWRGALRYEGEVDARSRHSWKTELQPVTKHWRTSSPSIWVSTWGENSFARSSNGDDAWCPWYRPARHANRSSGLSRFPEVFGVRDSPPNTRWTIWAAGSPVRRNEELRRAVAV
jgi:hypothetical protein